MGGREDGFWGSFAARVDVGAREAKGFAWLGEDVEEKGFGLADCPWLEGVAPKRLAPRSCLGLSSARVGCGPLSVFSGWLFCCWREDEWATLCFFTPRSPLILPCFLLQVFLGHPKIYSHRSS